MSAPPSDAGPSPDDDDLGDREEGADRDDPAPSGDAASTPEQARKQAEDALAEIEALADLDADPDPDTGPASGDASGEAPSAGAAAAPEPTGDPTADGATPEDQCENCGALLDGPYCSQCGQKSADRIVPVWHMINEALEAVFELDLRVFRTFPKFVFLPGRLTKEYINGRRKRYIRPFRLFLFATFLLFAVLAFTTTGGFGLVLDPQGMVRLNPPNTAITAPGPSSSNGDPSGSRLFGASDQREEIAQTLESDSTDITVTLFDDPEANARIEEALRRKTAQAVRNPKQFVERLIDRGPYLMFVMLPIFALLLKLLYVRRGRLYAEHMIFSLHIHAFTFFALTGGLLLDQSSSTWLQAAGTGVELSPLLYLVLAMSHVYDQGLIKSSVKAFILLLVYSIVLLLGFVVLLLLAILLM